MTTEMIITLLFIFFFTIAGTLAVLTSLDNDDS